MKEHWRDVWRHYKGGLYNVISIGFHTETEEKMVVYEGEDGTVWIRPLDMFIGMVEVDGALIYRFEKVDDSHK